MRAKFLSDFFRAIWDMPNEIRKARRLNKLREIAYGNPTTEEGFRKQREALRELSKEE